MATEGAAVNAANERIGESLPDKGLRAANGRFYRCRVKQRSSGLRKPPEVVTVVDALGVPRTALLKQ